jgi:hypothetical protein
MTEPVKKWLMPIREAMQSQHTSEPTRGNAISRRTVLMAGAIICVPFGHHLQAGLAAVKHVVLLGDSVFDNAAYVGRDPDVRRQLKDVLPKGSQVTLAARDGAVITDVASQLHGLPRDATHLIISVGGNDALLASGVLEERATSVSHALEKLAAIADRFSRDYSSMLGRAFAGALPMAVCTIYEPRFPQLARRRVAATALTLLNDCITREAFSRRLTLIDLRLICDRDEDFTNEIEPSASGGAKIARAIAEFASGASPSATVIGKSSH